MLGLTPGALEAELAKVKAIVPQPPAIQIGMPADLLRRRPDIRQAERTAAAASAAIGAAVAELFPKISLTGAAGLNSGTLAILPIFQADSMDSVPDYLCQFSKREGC